MNKHKHDWKHFSRRTLSLILVLVTLVALCIPTGMALEDNAADEAETPAVTVQAAESEPAAEPVALAETASEPVAEAEPTSEPEAEPATEPTSEPVEEPAAEPTSEPVEEPEQVSEPTSEPVEEPEQVSEPTGEEADEPETVEPVEDVDGDANDAAVLLTPDDGNAIAVQAALTNIDMTITDEIKANGLLKVTVPTGVTLGTDVTYKWLKSDSQDGTYTYVTRTKVTGSSYNVTEYGDQVNVVLDSGAQKWYMVEAYNADGNKIATSKAFQVNYYKEVQNGGFESPAIPSNYGNYYAANGASGLIWRTTGVDPENQGRDVEMGNNRNSTGLYNAYGITGNLIPEGNQVAELNAEAYGTLYQDVLTTPNATLNWQLYHTARMKAYSNGLDESSLIGFNRNGNSKEYSDVMYVMIMSTVTAEALNITSSSQTQAIVDAVNRGDSTYNGVSLSGVTVVKVEDGGKWAKETTGYGGNRKTTYTCNRYYVDSSGTKHYYKDNPSDTKWKNSEWTRWTGTYAVPAGQYMTRFFFVSYSSAYDTWKGSGNNYNTTIGNLLDDVKFTTDALPPDPDRGNLTVTKQVTGLADLPDDYSVTVSIGAGTTESYTFNAEDFTKVGDVWTASYSFQNIDANKNYTVTETDVTTVAGYNWTTADADKTQTVYLGDSMTKTVTFTNSYEQSTGSLKVAKTIVNDSKWMTDKELQDIKDNLTFTATNTVTNERKTFDVTWEGNTFTATIDGLPAGSTWTVSESGQDIYNKYYDCDTEIVGNTATIAAGGIQTVTITNTYTDKLVNLTINKTVTGDNKNAGSFTFVATNTHTGVSYTATIVTSKSGSYTISGIPAGEYTVTELDNDNYRHVDEATKTVIITSDTGKVSFENEGKGDSYQYSSSVVNKIKDKVGNDFKVKFEQFQSSTAK